jgi:putative heme-binding domain-containing protein
MSAYYARQIFNLGDEGLNKLLEEVWGQLRQSPKEKQQLVAFWQSKLTPEILADATISNGKAMFEKTCVSCHAIYGEGGTLGPHLDGSDRKNLYYLLENLIDPSAVLPQDYRMNVITLADGRVLSGNIAAKTRHTITLAGLESAEVIPISEIVEQKQLDQSVMPEGLLQTMSEQDVIDLIAFLQQ